MQHGHHQLLPSEPKFWMGWSPSRVFWVLGGGFRWVSGCVFFRELVGMPDVENRGGGGFNGGLFRLGLFFFDPKIHSRERLNDIYFPLSLWLESWEIKPTFCPISIR